MRAASVLARHQLTILRRDPWFLIIMLGMPLAAMPLLQRTMKLSLAAGGFDQANGAEQVVPGQTVMFSFFVAGSVAFSLFREHGWKTWDRLRASAVSPASMLVGFGLPWVGFHVVYQLTLFGAGAAFLGLRLNGGSPIAAIMVMAAYATTLIALVLAAATSFRTIQQVNALTNVGAIVFGGIGGALVPLDQLPSWAQTIAPVTPAYWAMQGHQSVFLEGGGVSSVLTPVAVLLAGAAALGLIARQRFRVDETKEFFA